MSKLRFSSEVIGDRLLYVRPRPVRLAGGESPLYGSPTGAVSAGGPSWIWEIRAAVYVSKSSMTALNDWIVSTKQFFQVAEPATLYQRDDDNTETEWSASNCRLDEFDPGDPQEASRASWAVVRLVFLTEEDPVLP